MIKKILSLLVFSLALLNVQSFAGSPTISSFSPSSGSVGTLVTIVGTNLGSPTAFTIGGVNAILVSDTSVIVSNKGDTLVGLIMPGAVTGTLSITTAGGTVISGSNFTITATPYPGLQQGNKLVGTGAIGTANQGYSVSISADGNTAIVGGNGDDNSYIGAAWVYTRSGGVWTQQGNKLIGTGAVGKAYQGYSVCISADGNTAIFGGENDNSGAGAAWVFTRSAGTWTQQGNKLVGTGAIGKAKQGWSVSISADGNTAIVGGSADNSNIGAVWVYIRSGGVWTQQGNKLVGTGAVGQSYQGTSVSISADGNNAVLGGYYDNSGIGAAWVYTRSGGVWTQQGNKLVGTGAIGTANQGHSVCISADGNTTIVGGYYDNSNIGASWVYTRSGGVWTQQGNKLVGTGAIGSTVYQGSAVSISADGNTAVLGGYYDNSGIGAIWVYTRSGGIWTQQGNKLIGTGWVRYPFQGFSVSISTDGYTALVGGGDDNSKIGAAWIFVPCISPTIPILGTSSSANCGTQTTTLNILTGTLNNSTSWQWYSGSPGGTSVGSGTSIAVSPSVTTKYYARGEGCGAPGLCDSVTITVNPIPTVMANEVSRVTCYGGANGSATVSVTGGTLNYTYLWSNGISGVTGISGLTAGTYTVSVTDAKGCTNSSTISISAINLLPDTPAICSVTVDTLSKYNIIIWNKPVNSFMRYYLIYRDTANNAYGLIGKIPFSALSQFTDTVRSKYAANGDPNISSWQYKIAVEDSCGNISALSPYHKTLFMQNSSGNFSWNNYLIEGQAVPIPELSNYLFQRDSISNGNFKTIATLSASSTAYTDPQYATYVNTASWRAITAWSISCTPTARMESSYSTTKSNVKTNAGIATGLAKQLFLESVKLFPNPTDNVFDLEFPGGYKSYQISIFNLLGDIVFTKEISGSSSVNNKYIETIDVSRFAKGMYSLSIQTETMKVFKKLVVQ